MVQLFECGKKRAELVREYELTPSAIDRWIHQFSTTRSFKTKDNITDEQRELTQLRKKNKQLLMENDILKQAALIMGRK
jgi:transposase